MASEIIKDYLIHNGETIVSQNFDYSATKVFPGIYEVIRVIDGIPLFTEKHMERFKSSSKLLGYELQIKGSDLVLYMKKLISINDYKYGNIKIVINNLDKPVQDNYLYFMKASYPSQEEIENGVPVILFYGERNNPNAKTTDLAIRERINKEISDNAVYEALLVNSKNEITEGSRSNVFFVKGSEVYTPTVESVLPGVTRGYVIDICKKLGLTLKETPVYTEVLDEIDGLFLTGTSPQVLPISKVDKKVYDSPRNSIIKSIRQAYEDMVKDYIDTHR